MTERVVIHKTPNFEYACDLQPGDRWTTHPAGGVIVCNPHRKPVWFHVTDGCIVQETLEVSASDNMTPIVRRFFDT